MMKISHYISHVTGLSEKDVRDIYGTLGAVITLIIPKLDSLTKPIQVLGGIGGLVLLGFSIVHKIFSIKRERLEIKKLKTNNHGNERSGK